MKYLRLHICLIILIAYALGALAQDEGKRKISVIEDRNQTYFSTKTYKLKHVDPADNRDELCQLCRQYKPNCG